jgi:ElaB/YqjD/DUF883 family membrane-anchored ribosome-binding protein
MNPSPENQTDALRNDIDVTRQRMDNTMDQLGDRLQPRHLLDEVLGYFRAPNADGEPRLDAVREKISASTQTAIRSVADTVKSNPMPALLIGAGIAWMIYESTRDKSSAGRDAGSREEVRYDPDTHYDRPLEYPTRAADQLEFGEEDESKLGQMTDAIAEKASDATETVKEKLAEVSDQARDKLANVRERAGEKLQAAKERATELGSQAKEKARVAYTKTRDTVKTTANDHPLEVGLACLAAGLIAGLALPTPEPVNRIAGPTADRLRQRTRDAGSDLMEKGKRVARAAASAVQEEAKSQGLTLAHLRGQAEAVAQRATEATEDAAQREGLGADQENADQRDPSTARPAQ